MLPTVQLSAFTNSYVLLHLTVHGFCNSPGYRSASDFKQNTKTQVARLGLQNLVYTERGDVHRTKMTCLSQEVAGHDSKMSAPNCHVVHTVPSVPGVTVLQIHDSTFVFWPLDMHMASQGIADFP